MRCCSSTWRVGDGPDIALQRPTPLEQLAAWQQRRAGNAVAPESVVLVATSGGGISAAYWTASTLAHLEQKFVAPFTERLFAVSGVSGGSLGRATYVALKRAGLETGQTNLLLDQVREVLGHDVLSPVVQVIDLLEPRYGLGDIRTSAAAGASARFTYVSPAGTVHVEDGDTLRLVDGGYFENSGAASMTDLITLLVKNGVALKPILIIIDNDTTAPNLCRRDGSVDQLPSGEGFNSTVSEVTAPAQALLQTRAARGNLAEVTAANLVEGIGGTVIEVPLASVLRARLAALGAADAETIAAVESRYVEPPLGWSLSQEVRQGMDNTLQNEQGGLDRQLRYLAIALGLEQGEVPPCAAH